MKILDRNTVVICFLVISNILIFVYSCREKKNVSYKFEGINFEMSADQDVASDWNADQWESWRDSVITSMLLPTFVTDQDTLIFRDSVISRSERIYKFLAPFLSDSTFITDSSRGKVLINLVTFVRSQYYMSIKDSTGKNTNALGYNITDKKYWDINKINFEFPALLQNQYFLEKMSKPSLYRDAVAMIDSMNKTLVPSKQWIVLPFRAQFIQNVGGKSFGRILVLIPNDTIGTGEIVDKWILYSIATPDLTNGSEIQNVSMITIRKKEDEITHKAFLMDFMRLKDSTNGKIRIEPNVLLANDRSKNCYDCHKSSILPIKPKFEYAFDSKGQLIPKEISATVSNINSRIRDYGLADYEFLDPNSYGPTLGSSNISRTNDFITAVTKNMNIQSSSYPTIIKAMNCGKCHDDFARLNYLQAVRSNRDIQAFSESKKGLVQTYIEKGWMPPRNKLTDDERLALWKCLSSEYLNTKLNSGVLIEWLKGNNSF
jgi:hypothetical protein